MEHRPELTAEAIEGMRRGDAEAVTFVYRTLSGPLYGYLLRRWGDPASAQDLVADVFIEVLESIQTFEGPPAAFRAWVFRIARNTLIDHARKEGRRRHASVDEAAEAGDLPAAADSPERDALGRLEQARILRLVDELSADQRDVVLLRLVADLPIADVADIIGKTPGAVKLLQHRALQTLRRRLGEEGEAQGEA